MHKSSRQQSDSSENRGEALDNRDQDPSNSQQQPYSNAMGLRNTLHGIIYQVKLLIFFLQTALNNKHEFSLYSEKENADKFDDVIFQCDTDGQYRFLQAKHKSNPESKITRDELLSDNLKKPFNLLKYFQSFLKIKQHPQYKDNIKDLIICTNCNFDEDVREKLFEYVEPDDIFNIDGSKRFKFLPDEDVIQNLKDLYRENITRGKGRRKNRDGQSPCDPDLDVEIRRFFEKLVFAVGQPNVNDLSEIIQKRTLECLDDLKDNVQARFICDYVERKILDWLKQPRSDPLSREDDFFKEGREKIREIMFHAIQLEYVNHVGGLDVTFNNECREIRELIDFLNSEGNVLNLVSFEGNLSASQAKVYQVKRQPGWYLKNLLKLTGDDDYEVKNLFKDDLLIVCESDDELNREDDTGRLSRRLIDFTKVNPNKKIILITQSNGVLANCFKRSERLKNNYKEISDTMRIEDLDLACLKEKLLNRTIVFQDRQEQLTRLMDIDIDKLNNPELRDAEIGRLREIIQPDALGELISNAIPIVGSKLPDFKDPTSPYYDPCYTDIPRKYSRQVISKNSLRACTKKRTDDLFAFASNVKESRDTFRVVESIVPSEERDKMKDFADRDDSFFEGRFFALSDPKAEIDELRDNNVEGRVIHWLNYTGDDKFTVKYSNKLSNLRKFIEMECLGERIENRNVVILFGTAGVGKSTVLTAHSQKMGLLSWSVRVNLRDHRKYLKEAKLEESDGIVGFLCQSDAGLKSALAKSLLRYYLTKDKKRVILFLDGYDEIENDSQEKINRSIRYFENTRTEVWLTSRLSEQERIEEALGTVDFSYFLNPFDVPEQDDFLRRYWTNNPNVKEKDCIDRFAGELLEHFHKLGLMKKEGLIGIVLQARMVADIFHPKSKFDPAEIGILNVWDLYERFIGHQYARYFTEKVRIDIGLLGKGSRDGLTELYTRAYGHVALKLLFPYDNFCDEFLRNEKCHVSLRRELIDIGIVRNVKRDDYRGGLVANFIHHTYAEYFVAKLSISLINNDAYYQPLRKFLLTNLSLDRNRLIRIFLEYEMRRVRIVAVKRKWEMIRLFLGRTEIEDGSLFNSIPVDNSNRRDKTLRDLTNDVKACVSVESDKYNFNGDANLMEQFLWKLSECTDIEELKNVLRFLLEIDKVIEIKIDKFEEFNLPFLLETNLEFSFRQYNAVLHYFTQSKLQNKLDLAFEREIMRFVYDTRHTFIKNFRRTLDELNEARNTRDTIEKERRFLLLAELSIRECEYFRDDLISLNQIVYHAFNVYDQDAVDYINSVKRIQESFKIEMLSFLERINFNEKKGQIAEVLVDANVKYIQTFIIEIFHHPNIIADIKSSIDEMFLRNKSNILWLEGAGVLISRFLKILTYGMSSVFTSIIENISSLKDKDKEKIYCYRILYDLLMYLLHTLEIEELPHIDKIAFFEMMTRFIEIFVKNEKFLPFTSNHLKMALSLLQYILNQPDMGVKFYNIARFLSALDSVKIRITRLANGKILFLDPRTEFKFELSSNYKDRMRGIPSYIGSL